MRHIVWGLAGCLAAITLVVAACSGESSSDDKITVVTSTDVWGAVASAVAGENADVTSLYTNADGDPHDYNPSAADTASVVDADVVVVNGGHYDAFMEEAASKSKGIVVNAFGLLGADGHGHGAVNEHVFYDLAVVQQVADKVAAALADKDSARAEHYHANAAAFDGQLAGLRTKLAAIKTVRAGTKVAQTEPLAGYLLGEAGLADVAPDGFTQAVEEGQGPAGADVAAMRDLLNNRVVHALIYNAQAVDNSTKSLLPIADHANIPVLRFTETLPDGVTGYIAWQTAQIDALSAALSVPAR